MCVQSVYGHRYLSSFSELSGEALQILDSSHTVKEQNCPCSKDLMEISLAKKGRKVRVAFRKNREKKKRKRDFTRELHAGDNVEDLNSVESVRGKGELIRHRTVIAETTEDGSILLEVDLSACRPARVLSAVGLNCLVENEAGEQILCTVRRVLRTLSREARNAVVAGDRVLYRPDEHENGMIERVEPRQSTLSRTSGGKEHILVANTDQVLIVVAADQVEYKTNLIDRFVVSAEKGNARAIICINKCDLIDPVQLQPLVGLYAQLGYRVVLCSATTGYGIDELRHLLKDHQTVLTGQSGVGKSSILNTVDPEMQLKTGEVNKLSSKGKHTTRTTNLLKLDFGGWVVDTPGIRQLDIWDVTPEEIEEYFVEFHPHLAFCKFPDCTHTHEKACGVKQAMEDELISERRYESYLRLIDQDYIKSDSASQR